MFKPPFKSPWRPVAASALLAMATSAAWAQTPDCAALAAKAAPGMVLKTEAIAADTQRAPGATTGPMLTAHCKVTGRMN